MAKSVIVYGPQVCGKTRDSKKIAKHFGLKVIVEMDTLHRLAELKPKDHLYLTCDSVAYVTQTDNKADILVYKAIVKIVTYEAAMKAVHDKEKV